MSSIAGGDKNAVTAIEAAERAPGKLRVSEPGGTADRRMPDCGLDPHCAQGPAGGDSPGGKIARASNR